MTFALGGILSPLVHSSNSLFSGGRVTIEYQEPLGCDRPGCDYKTGLYISEYQRYNALRSHLNFQHSTRSRPKKKSSKKSRPKTTKGKKALLKDKPVEVIADTEVQWV